MFSDIRQLWEMHATAHAFQSLTLMVRSCSLLSLSCLGTVFRAEGDTEGVCSILLKARPHCAVLTQPLSPPPQPLASTPDCTDANGDPAAGAASTSWPGVEIKNCGNAVKNVAW